MFVSQLCPLVQADEARERPWFVGYAEADITPAPGQVQMSGFGRERYAGGALASLLTQAVVLRDGEDNIDSEIKEIVTRALNAVK